MKVAIVGAGFSGLIFSNYLLDANIDVDLYEEHSKVGIPEHCTGIISSLTSKLIGEVSKNNIIKKYTKLKITSFYNSVEIYTKDDIIKLDRVKLENDLLNLFINRGGNAFLNKKIKEINYNKILNKNYDAILLSDGINGFIHKKYGLGFQGRTIYGINQEFCINNDEDLFEVRFDNKTSNNFFSWYVPLRDKIIIGTGAENPQMLMNAQNNAIKSFNIKSNPCHTYGGLIISGIKKANIRNGNIIAIGDTIGLTKPLTGGGLFPNSLAAYFSYSLIKKGYNILDSIESSISFVLSMLKKTNNLSMILHKNPTIIEEIIEISKKSNLLESMNRKIDYDFHIDLIRNSLKDKNSYKFLLGFTSSYPISLFKLGIGILKDLI
ncbi:NAD(P)/FAD-dependent oxidoreductase [Caldisphaera sp.]|uniref:NAD(P)-binding protein n=1 Tax=Caldisphaera sp. TaxID=2060322 RepID=UPI0025C1DA75|nr:NAD(P)/FAD-dependent oxidoreductase [Caldisphaera sp.]